MSLYALDAVEDAIATTRAFLLPFDLRRWAKLALLVFFVGTGGSGANPVQFTNSTSGWSSPGPGGTPQLPTGLPQIGTLELAIIAAVGVFVLLVWLAFAYVGALFEFVFVESLREEEVHIREYWREFRALGRRLFAFRIVLGLLFLLVAGGIVAVAAAPYLLGAARLSFGLLALAALLLVGLAIFAGLIRGFTTEFVVPVMLLEDRGVLEAWRQFWPVLTEQWKQFAAYVVVRFVLAIAAGILLGLVVGLATLLLAIPFGVLGVAGYLLVSTQAVLGWAVVAFAFGLFVLSFLALSLLAAVPVGTYFRYYALLVLGDTEAQFDAIPDQRTAARG